MKIWNINEKKIKKESEISMETNKKCLENILLYLTTLIMTSEYNGIDELERLVDMSTSVSAQLLASDEEYEESEEL